MATRGRQGETSQYPECGDLAVGPVTPCGNDRRHRKRSGQGGENGGTMAPKYGMGWGERRGR